VHATGCVHTCVAAQHSLLASQGIGAEGVGFGTTGQDATTQATEREHIRCAREGSLAAAAGCRHLRRLPPLAVSNAAGRLLHNSPECERATSSRDEGSTASSCGCGCGGAHRQTSPVHTGVMRHTPAPHRQRGKTQPCVADLDDARTHRVVDEDVGGPQPQVHQPVGMQALHLPCTEQTLKLRGLPSN
jgi:hypothetical protein